MGTIELLDHTADVGLQVHGRDLDDLFRTCAQGLMDYVVANRHEVRTEVVESVSLRADSPEELLMAWLSELIFRVETRQRVYATFQVQVAEHGKSLNAELRGEPIDPHRHLLDHEVKAVTRHDFQLSRTDQGWTARFILDI